MQKMLVAHNRIFVIRYRSHTALYLYTVSVTVGI